jgi:hypothetical protein
MRIAILIVIALVLSGCSAQEESVESQLATLQKIHSEEIESWDNYRKMRMSYEIDIMPGPAGISKEGQEIIKANKWDDLKGRDKELWKAYTDAVYYEKLHNDNANALWKKMLPLREKLGLK